MAATRFHLIRHAAHDLLSHRLAGRMPGVSLSHEGQEQAERLSARLSTASICAVISSPVLRAIETATPIARALRLPILTEPGIQEIDFGDWTGKTFDTLAEDPAWATWNAIRGIAACPNGETMHAAQSRALDVVYRLNSIYAGQDIVVVTHSDIIKAILAPALGLPLDRLYRLTINPASISTLVIHAHDMTVDGINR